MEERRKVEEVVRQNYVHCRNVPASRPAEGCWSAQCCPANFHVKWFCEKTKVNLLGFLAFGKTHFVVQKIFRGKIIKN